jgi:S-DNA-T family DNA segregation ATPase FtsK/SpoIIIE
MSKRKAARKAGVPGRRKREVLGLVLVTIGVLLALAILTYEPADDYLAQRFSIWQALSPGNNQASNALGLLGAWLARVLVLGMTGYFSLVFAVLPVIWGYTLLRNRSPVYLPLVSVLLVAAALVLAAISGWFGLTTDLDTTTLAGWWGVGTAGWMQRVVGVPGSLALLVSASLIITLLLVDHDIQRSIDRAEAFLGGMKSRFVGWRREAKSIRTTKREGRGLEESRATEERPRTPRRADATDIPAVVEPDIESRAEAAAKRERERQRRKSAARPAVDRAHTRDPSGPQRVDGRGGPTPTIAEQFEAESTDGPVIHIVERIEEERTDHVDREDQLVADENLEFNMPDLDLLDEPDADAVNIDYDELEENKQVLLDKLAVYNIEITDINAIVGPTVTLYELTPAPGVKISKITSLEDDLAMAMAARGIRMIAPIPGKSAIGVEIPNRKREFVRIRDLIGTARFSRSKMQLPLVLGKSIEGEVFILDLTKMPHLLIAGATGSGKSVGLNACITGLLYACHPSNLKFVMVDPKKIELQQYARIMEHYIAMPEDAEDPIITDVAQALRTLRSCEREMEERYDLLSSAQVRSVVEYNKRFATGRLSPENGHRHLPYIVVVVDELADLMMTAGKDIEGPIARLAQMARAVGIHLILATQRPSVDVITGLIKANFPARVAYQVASKIDSRTILDQNGAQGLVGNGDLLYMLGSTIVRLQGPFVADDEVDRLTNFITDQPGPGPYRLPLVEDGPDASALGAYSAGDRDDLFDDAARIIVRSQQGSVSLLQRKLSIGYSRAARLVDQLEDAGIVGPFEGSKARQVLVLDEAELDSLLSAS